ncbi:MAG: phage virion morphogenesis protein [Burkholderiales bacterium]|nr:phage virion morphogenesis protein [Burkholderiales bacterium]
MSGVSARVIAQDVDGLVPALQRLALLGRAPRPLWKALGTYGENSTRERFKTGVGPDGVRWKISRRVRKFGGQTLVRSTRLLRGITNRADNDGAEWGTNAVYGAIHQFGGEIKKAARSGTVRLRLDSKSALLRQKDHRHLAVFAKATHKRAAEKAFTGKAHTIRMPARPYLGVNEQDGREMLAISLDVIDQAAGNGGAR